MNEVIKAGMPAWIPISYMAFFDSLADPMKLAGFLVLILQGIYILVKIRHTLRLGKDGDEQA